jgi:hypothetical protein
MKIRWSRDGKPTPARYAGEVDEDAFPSVVVTISQGDSLGETAVTQGLWKSLLPGNAATKSGSIGRSTIRAMTVGADLVRRVLGLGRCLGPKRAAEFRKKVVLRPVPDLG